MRKAIYTVVIMMFMAVANLSADVITSLSLKQGHNSNLFADSLAIDDFYNSLGAEVKFYPSSFTEFTVKGDYNLYYTNSDLSNFNGEASFTIIPTSDSSNLSLILSGVAGKRSFGTLFNLYNNENLSSDLYLIYRVSNRLSFKTGGYYSYVGYDNADEVTDKYLGFSGGLNFTFLNSNSFDFEAFVYKKKYNSNAINGADEPEYEYDFIDYKLRYSRPLGLRWGAALDFSYHNLGSYTDYSISGYTIDYLSPWGSLWNGPTVSLSLKHYLKNQSILALYASYADKEYVRSLDYTDIDNTIIESFQRSDQVGYFELKYYKNYMFEKYMITPVLTASVSENSSTLDLYDYSTFNIALSATFSF